MIMFIRSVAFPEECLLRASCQDYHSFYVKKGKYVLAYREKFIIYTLTITIKVLKKKKTLHVQCISQITTVTVTVLLSFIHKAHIELNGICLSPCGDSNGSHMRLKG